MKTLAIIPARYASSRFPGKPLALIQGKPMIQRVYEQAIQVFENVVVATDDERIIEAVHRFEGNFVMTSIDHKSGTDRCREALELFEAKTGNLFEIVINIQGDEPYIQPEQLKLLHRCISKEGVQIATLVKKIENIEVLFDRNVPKVILNRNREAIYFSRQTIPYLRNEESDHWLEKHTFYKHIGLYAYRKNILAEIARLKPSALEQAESLEQLRWIEHGYRITAEITNIESVSVDTPEDLTHL